MKAKVVVGLSFGDEGKGAMVDYLCKTEDVGMVVRFSGGHNAGHTVTATNRHKLKISPDKLKHTFSNFGSGTFMGVPTFWSKHCTFHPDGCVREFGALSQVMNKDDIKLYVDPMAPVTTPWDIAYNRMTESVNKHGSCGVGFSATVNRHETLKLHVMDMFNKTVLQMKLNAIGEWYKEKFRNMKMFNSRMLDHFDETVNPMIPKFRDSAGASTGIIKLMTEQEMLTMIGSDAHIVFEGAQGILLDQTHGFFPNVTRANTTSKNATDMLDRWKAEGYSNGRCFAMPTVVYVTRAYQTRHGAGQMTKEGDPALKLKNLRGETNRPNKWQGSLRTGLLDVDMLKHALTCDKLHSPGAKRSLAVTCLDQIDRMYMEKCGEGEFLGVATVLDPNAYVGQTSSTSTYNVESLAKAIGIGDNEMGTLYTSDSPVGMNRKQKIQDKVLT